MFDVVSSCLIKASMWNSYSQVSLRCIKAFSVVFSASKLVEHGSLAKPSRFTSRPSCLSRVTLITGLRRLAPGKGPGPWSYPIRARCYDLSLRAFSRMRRRMRRRALTPHLWYRPEPNWSAGHSWLYLETPTVETESQLREKFESRNNKNLVDRFAKAHERAAYTPRWKAAQAAMASLSRGSSFPFLTCTLATFLRRWSLVTRRGMTFARDSWRIMSTLQCGVMNMVACGAANSSFTQDLFRKTRKMCTSLVARCEYSRC